ncbi:hypothetical protein ECHHL_0236 [Ehrlichia chaffeensis str. Heartland]|uniref:Uncharacterized protein n=1 Tax=Ehrlichia chaffeensis (strain ATCC CRL-10679 / Arkansas) TaxID=205920 RepID=Q2GHH6_EHRCR|nr:hypothetical protein ECH_0286 [Ehrlichia chaffeensis str. Arkansas]AHX03402.1 hypothetical protein ECHHL_0236 [Ehrlichia chaffeensis str. Heartland]AHX05877.1 hypothetical protein ECHJAX_0821 [Ehrlichia chaffeensis str. Jax]AHX06868.1 hypothetical protein ECHLIB_0824 [Ehrlichia chaffeensis str. Liberty]AHX07300.1 hypothetical protein ECHOSC_0245 [Ehrlichia chaffeensis str. Osceola]AHX08419.1 hypothetical protein ECHSTV_0811 [Ehrlichia chaffeensis str. Saint Vincent]AHX09420.1 hypothetical 
MCSLRSEIVNEKFLEFNILILCLCGNIMHTVCKRSQVFFL